MVNILVFPYKYVSLFLLSTPFRINIIKVALGYFQASFCKLIIKVVWRNLNLKYRWVCDCKTVSQIYLYLVRMIKWTRLVTGSTKKEMRWNKAAWLNRPVKMFFLFRQSQLYSVICHSVLLTLILFLIQTEHMEFKDYTFRMFIFHKCLTVTLNESCGHSFRCNSE